MWFENIFFQSLAGLFLHLTESFAEQNHFILMRLNLSIVSFKDCASESSQKKLST